MDAAIQRRSSSAEIVYCGAHSSGTSPIMAVLHGTHVSVCEVKKTPSPCLDCLAANGLSHSDQELQLEFEGHLEA